MRGKRQKIQYSLALEPVGQGETRSAVTKGPNHSWRSQQPKARLPSNDSMSLPQRNPVEPPWYGPVCPVVGEGWHREVSPYPDRKLRTNRAASQAQSPQQARRSAD